MVYNWGVVRGNTPIQVNSFHFQKASSTKTKIIHNTNTCPTHQHKIYITSIRPPPQTPFLHNPAPQNANKQGGINHLPKTCSRLILTPESVWMRTESRKLSRQGKTFQSITTLFVSLFFIITNLGALRMLLSNLLETL